MMNTLIITVGTRQVGWRDEDGTIYCFGLDGDKKQPSHIDHLYKLIGVQRGTHHESECTYPCSVRDLAERYHEHCTEWLGGDFQSVELLLDCCVIEQLTQQGLQSVILWGTDQPDTVSWNFRRLDTLWLAKLMAGKIRNKWPQLSVDVFDPIVAVNDISALRQELEDFLLRLILERAQRQDGITLYIQNKGSVPQISDSLAICAAGLIRQCNVITVLPQEPSMKVSQPNHLGIIPAIKASISTSHSIGSYFWPVERLRVISALERGDFKEAQIWLEPHRNRYEALCKLSTCLAYFFNGESSKFRRLLNDWLKSNAIENTVPDLLRNQWIAALEQYCENESASIWENNFITLTLMRRENYSNAFIIFTQSLERVLYQQHVKINSNNQNISGIRNEARQPNFEDLIDIWCNNRNFNRNISRNNWCKLLHSIRMKRNLVVHKGESLNLADLRQIWTNSGFAVKYTQDSEIISNLQIDLLKELFHDIWCPPRSFLLQDLCEWSIQRLRAEVPGY